MPSFIADHPMLCAVALILIDIAVWRLISPNLANWKLAARLVIFAVFSAVLFNGPCVDQPHTPGASSTIRSASGGLSEPNAAAVTDPPMLSPTTAMTAWG